MDEAFILLLEKKDFQYITIKEICKKAGVNRWNFYLHYENTFDLAKECNKNLNKEFLNYFQGNSLFDVSKNELDELYLIDDKYLIFYLKFVKKNKSFFKVVSRHSAVFDTNKQFEKLTKNIIYPILEKVGVDKNDCDYYVTFFIKGIMSIIFL